MSAQISVDIPMTDLLMGGENGCPADIFALLIGDPLRPSTPISRSPHVEFLKDYIVLRDEIFSPERFSQTRYWQNAKQCIQLQGQYFASTTMDGVIDRAKRFVRMYNGERIITDPRRCESVLGSEVTVRRISFCECYEVADGHHRLAVNVLSGAQRYRCTVLSGEPVLTPMQLMVLASSWTEGEHIVYQPIDLPEFHDWPAVRKCTDRLDMMKGFLSAHDIETGSFLDIGCSYGWFVKRMGELGYDAFGVDRDTAATATGKAVYGLDSSRIIVDEFTNFLQNCRRFDVVSCFSVLHHFILGRGGSMPPTDFIRLVDAVTGSVLFLDTGESHEEWFKVGLRDWNASYIAGWLRQHTSFSSVEVIGTDDDGKGRYKSQYGRHLFACRRG
jgi:SAM-dependent methyltransferase